MNIKKILDEIQKDRPKGITFPNALDARDEVMEMTAGMHESLAKSTIKKLEVPMNRLEEIKKDLSDGVYEGNVYTNVANDVSYLLQRLEIAQKALEWYADTKNYHHVESASYSDAVLDEGEHAQKALDKLKE